ncbi:hypothetical protein [Microcella humidisoli]|uniref:BNR repeat-containing family member n=1 Tax=Microcella humidisoli TaxID=2963406 RepID=A0ABY5FY19_9MICO|nr:hypothetical protein [Microcella humidisoli]UTT63022.1 hypothetical protein NNL39_02625 [Microcella humidisoli]
MPSTPLERPSAAARRAAVMTRGRAGVALAAALALTAGLLAMADARPAEAARHPACAIVPDGIYSSWVNPLAAADGGYWWIGSISRDGTNAVSRVDCATGVVDRVALGGPERADDHNATAIAIDPDEPQLLAVYSTHAARTHARFRWVDRQTLVASEEQRIEFGAPTTYAQLLQTDDTLTLIVRAGQNWKYVRSTDWGATWSEPATLTSGETVRGMYLLARPGHADDRHLVSLAHYAHPTAPDWRSVGTATLDLSTGEIALVDGTVIGSLDEPGGPALLPGEFDQVVVPTGTTRVRLHDVGRVNGAPAVVYAAWKGTDTAHYRYKIWNGSRWTSGTWGQLTGRPFGYTYATRYVGGAAFIDGGLITSRQTPTTSTSGSWTITYWRCTWGAGCRATSTFTTTRSAGRMVRPYVVYSDTERLVMIQQMSRYAWFTDYRADLLVRTRPAG